MAYQTGAYFCFHEMKNGNTGIPPGWEDLPLYVTLQHSLSIKVAPISWVERGAIRVKHLAKDTVSLANVSICTF